jgi:hypothetical protein
MCFLLVSLAPGNAFNSAASVFEQRNSETELLANEVY